MRIRRAINLLTICCTMIFVLPFSSLSTSAFVNLSQATTNCNTQVISPVNETAQVYLPEEVEDPVAWNQSVYAAWISNRNAVYLEVSNDSGATFGQLIRIDNHTGSMNNARLAVYGPNVYSVWQQTINATTYIMFRASHDQARTFDGARVLGIGFGSQIAVSKNNVYVGWSSGGSPTTPGPIQAVVVVSHDNGSTFGLLHILNDPNASVTKIQEVALATFGSNFYATWENQIGLSR